MMKNSVIERMCVVEKDYDRFIRMDLRKRAFSGCLVSNALWKDDGFCVTVSSENEDGEIDYCTFRFAGNVKIKAHKRSILETSWELQSLKSSYVNDMSAKQRFSFAFIGEDIGFRVQSYAVYVCEYVRVNKKTNKTMKEENYEKRMSILVNSLYPKKGK